MSSFIKGANMVSQHSYIVIIVTCRLNIRAGQYVSIFYWLGIQIGVDVPSVIGVIRMAGAEGLLEETYILIFHPLIISGLRFTHMSS